MEIRRAGERDIDALAALYVEFHNFHAEGMPAYLRPVPGVDAELRTAIRGILADEQAAVFVACAPGDGLPVGFAEIYIKEAESGPAVVGRRYGNLQSLMVTKALRGTGLGARLAHAAHDWALARGATEIRLDTWEFAAGPLGFYEHLGYTTVRRQLVWQKELQHVRSKA